MKVHIADTGLSNVVSVLAQWPPHHQRAWPLAGCWLGLVPAFSLDICRAAELLLCCRRAFLLLWLPPHSLLLLLARLGQWSLDLVVKELLVLVM